MQQKWDDAGFPALLDGQAGVVHIVGNIDTVFGVNAGGRAALSRGHVAERRELFPAFFVEPVLQGLRCPFADSLHETIQLDGEAHRSGALVCVEVGLRAGVRGQIVKLGFRCAHVKLVGVAEGNESAPAKGAFGVVAGGKRRSAFRVGISNQREERTALHGQGRSLAERVDQGWRQVHQACGGVHTLAGRTIAGKFQEQGHMDRRIVKENAVGQFAVFAQRFAVIGGDGDQRVVV